MTIPDWLQTSFLQGVDVFFAHWPQPLPSPEQLRRCKIVAHRGEHDNRNVFENTLEAFDIVQRHGLWGIELDVRWTQDWQPVIFHDEDARRLFQQDLTLRQVTWVMQAGQIVSPQK